MAQQGSSSYVGAEQAPKKASVPKHAQVKKRVSKIIAVQPVQTGYIISSTWGWLEKTSLVGAASLVETSCK